MDKCSPHGQKLGCKSPRVGQIFGAECVEGGGGGVYMDEIDTCIVSMKTGPRSQNTVSLLERD